MIYLQRMMSPIFNNFIQTRLPAAKLIGSNFYFSLISIHSVPNLSRNIPKRFANPGYPVGFHIRRALFISDYIQARWYILFCQNFFRLSTSLSNDTKRNTIHSSLFYDSFTKIKTSACKKVLVKIPAGKQFQCGLYGRCRLAERCFCYWSNSANPGQIHG